jgi:hypothetical protein
MRTTFALLLSLVSTAAFAAPVSVGKIQVAGIEPNYLNRGDSLTFTGADALRIYEALPAIRSVGSAEELADSDRVLLIESRTWVLKVSCLAPLEDVTTCKLELGTPKASVASFRFVPDLRIDAMENKLDVDQVDPVSFSEGDEIAFWGGEAEKFKNLLPSASANEYSRVHKLSVRSPAWTVEFNCNGPVTSKIQRQMTGQFDPAATKETRTYCKIALQHN